MLERQGVKRKERGKKKKEEVQNSCFFSMHRVSQSNASPPACGVVTALPKLHHSHRYDYRWSDGGQEGEMGGMEGWGGGEETGEGK